jgi:hypothetical protein
MNGESEETIKSELLERFNKGLNSDLYIEINVQKPATFYDAYNMAQYLELLKKKYKADKCTTNLVNATQKVRKSRICYFCRKPGHVISKCREKMKAEKSVNCPPRRYDRFMRMEQRRPNEYDRWEKYERREHDYVKEKDRYSDRDFRDETDNENWRRPSYKDESVNWRSSCNRRYGGIDTLLKGSPTSLAEMRSSCEHDGRPIGEMLWSSSLQSPAECSSKTTSSHSEALSPTLTAALDDYRKWTWNA